MPNSNFRIFLDSGNSNETKQSLQILKNFPVDLAGQTTNPSLVAKNPQAQQRLQTGNKFPSNELLDFYKNTIQDISKQIPNGSVSIEVYADQNSTAKELLIQAEKMYTWIDNAHIKFPTIPAGLEAAENFVNSGGRVNMTLVFSQEQALAVHLATQKATYKGQVFISPFIGRLDDIGENGINLISNIKKMYTELDSQVEILAASIRTSEHTLAAIQQKAEILTLPFKVIQNWKSDSNSFLTQDAINNLNFESDLKDIEYQDLSKLYNQKWTELSNIAHNLTDKGLTKFAVDWNSLIV